MTNKTQVLLGLIILMVSTLKAQSDSDLKTVSEGLSFRSIGPAFTSGRISDLAIHPNNPHVWYVAAASGGVWKTENAGTTFTPIFDSYSSYSIGCVCIDPQNPNIIWVGTGENNNQRSVAYGDGVYKSEDGGKSFINVGLKQSEHIGNIAIDPNNSQIVYVAAYGPLWKEGGERGLYKTTDGGKSWERILAISEHTGVNEVHLDPTNSQIIYAAAHQRRRHVHTYIGGGPESAIYKSIDGGKNFKKLEGGLPSGVDVGRIGLAIAPSNPNVIYAIIEAQYGKEGIYKSHNKGASWQKVNGQTTSGNYYQELFCDPLNEDKLFIMDSYPKYSVDGGKTILNLPITNKHVDDHCLWIDPKNTNHYLMGSDGGLYETWDNAATWHFKANLPITQFYKIAVDNSKPFYYVYGGTQDNFSFGGPSQTLSANGIVNSDWFVTNGGDGFKSQVDPENPNIVYSQAQYGWLVRYDRKSGDKTFIQPQPEEGEAAFRWNWDAPLLISPHNNKRLYFAANKLFRSDDQGNSWQRLSPDLTQQIDRNKIPVMDKIWSVDAIMKNQSTSIYGNIVALDESPLKEDLIYIGTDDGLIQISKDAGKSGWLNIDEINGVPKNTYVNMLLASQHQVDAVYAVFNNHKEGDFKPYLFKSENQGKSWTNISSNLPERGSVYAIAEDHKDPNLLFAGTEFGVFFTTDGGKKWHALKSGLPTIAIRDIAIHKEENDLVLGTFGRGIYILDNYSPLRELNKETLEKPCHIFPIEDGLMYNLSNDLGRGSKGFQGDAFYSAANPKVGVVICYYLKETSKTLQQQRKDLEKKEKDNPYPTWAELEKEDREQKPFVLLTVSDSENKVIRKFEAPAKKGLHRIVWDFQHYAETSLGKSGDKSGRMVMPGKYFVSIKKSENGVLSPLHPKVGFNCIPLHINTFETDDRQALDSFTQKVAHLQKAVDACNSYLKWMEDRNSKVGNTFLYTSQNSEAFKSSQILKETLHDYKVILNGNSSLSKREVETLPSVNQRINLLVYGILNSSVAPTQTFINSYKLAYKTTKKIIENLKQSDLELKKLEKELDILSAPYTPGRLPDL